MRRSLTALALVALLAAATAGSARPAHHSVLKFTVRISQGPTFRHPHPPAGDAGDVFSTTLTEFATSTIFGTGGGKKVGEMSFSYVLHGTCSSTAAGCSGNSDITTVTTLPGGTLSAARKAVPFSKAGFVLPIQSGTGKFKGATGVIAVAPNGQALTTYSITLP
jgi:hypothetical protein